MKIIQLSFHNDAQRIGAIALTRFSGILSFLGSLIILYTILSDRQNKLKRIHYRLLTGVSFYDLLYSIAMIVSTAAIPRNTEDSYHVRGNIGNDVTCKAQGFFIQLGGLGVPLYLASLSLYYLMVVRYNVKDDYIRHQVEPFMHIISITLPVTTAVAALCLDLYNQKIFICWIEAKPWGCNDNDSIPCTAGGNATLFKLAFVLIWVAIAFLFEVASMGLIYSTVRKRERIMNSFSFRGRNRRVLVQSSSRVAMERRDTAIQALLYIASFIFTYSWMFGSYLMHLFHSHRPKAVYALLTLFFTPLLGFWNFLSFMRPRYVRLSRENRDATFLWKVRAIITSETNSTSGLLSMSRRRRTSIRISSRRRSSAASQMSTVSAVYIACTHAWSRFVRVVHQKEYDVDLPRVTTVLEANQQLIQMKNSDTPSIDIDSFDHCLDVDDSN